MIALFALANAGILGAVGSEVPVDLDRSGNWARVFAADDGWDFFFASGGDYQWVPLDEDFTPNIGRQRRLTGRTDLIDHAITRCPDGSWLHIGSRTDARLDDGAWAFRYDADMSRVAEAELYAGEPSQIHRDMPVVCGERFHGTGFFDPDNFVSFTLVELDDDLGIVRTVEPDEAPIVTGSSLYEDGDTLGIVSFPGGFTDQLLVREYDVDTLELLDLHLQSVSDATHDAYWSQGHVQVGTRHVVAHMSRDPSEGWQSQDGDVWLSVFSADWRIEEQVQVTHNTAPIGAMQPGLTVKDDTLVVTYTRDLGLYVTPVALIPEEEPPSPGCPRSGWAFVGVLFFPFARRSRRPS